MGWGSKIKKAVFGESKNEQLDTLNADQKNYLSGMFGALNPNLAGNINMLQGQANEGYNPYDEAMGTELVNEMMRAIDVNKQDQVNAIKGGSLNRFSMASQKAKQDVYETAMNQKTNLAYNDLLTKANFNQQAYGNQTQALNSLFQLGNAGLGVQTFQNQQNYNPGLFSYINETVKTAGNISNTMGSIFGGSGGSKTVSSTNASAQPRN